MAKTRAVSLSDKYLQQSGDVYISGMQALVRLPLLQCARDRLAGHNTAGLVTGYRGSPIGGYDRELARVESLLADHHIRFQPGLNEDLAATACWGAQQIELIPGARHEGVFCIWYGKSPGLDRSTDAMKHASHYGTSRLGGVLAVVGDDHLAKSSAFGHQSEYGFVDCLMPILAPSSIAEILEFGLLGFALSRYCGAWVGYKLAGSICEGSATVRLPNPAEALAGPVAFEMPAGGVHIRWPDDPGAIEHRAKHVKLPAAQAFLRASGADRVLGAVEEARLGIVAPGRAFQQVIEALAQLSLSLSDLRRLGVRLYKPAMLWPLEPHRLLKFADGLETILVIEDKRPLVEDQVKLLLYGRHETAPRVIGKRDERGAELLPEVGEIEPLSLALVLSTRLGLPEQASRSLRERLALPTPPPEIVRSPYFCAGCPHNTSTRVPDGSVAIGGIGCHTLAMGMGRGMLTFSHMGGEGATWIGLAPFTDLPHVFQNMGDGTYQHSGSLCIRAAVAAEVSITFKILYNGAVAMTGGQPVEGQPSVPRITRQLADEGVRAIAVVTDDPARYEGVADLAPGASIHHRRELDSVQRRLRQLPGVTVIVYDQTCAAELRRRRKRGTSPEPARRIYINELVCEGCGDCGRQSNCVAILPSVTEFGTKRQIDQSACNKDYSCLEGLCPSFVTVEGGRLRQRPPHLVPGPLPENGPGVSLDDQPWSLLLAGIGGTGVVTVGAILGVAAHAEGLAATVNDVTGMAQKGGPVLGHVRIARTQEHLGSERIPLGGANLLIAADLVVATMPDALSRTGPGTRAVANTDATPTGEFTRDPAECIDSTALEAKLRKRLRAVDSLPALRAARAVVGDPVAAGLLLLGHAWQLGLVPLSTDSIEHAIGLNEVAVDRNLAAFRWGRRFAADPQLLSSLELGERPAERLDDLIERRVEFLIEYQDRAYAERYAALTRRVRQRELSVAPGTQEFTESVARTAFKLMAYKDEYEVARLYGLSQFKSRLKDTFEGAYRLRVHLAPPMIARTHPITGRPRKIAFGGWVLRVFPLLASLRFLRGTPFDPFGWTAERRLERRLVQEYFELVQRLCDELAPVNLALAIEQARLPLSYRGFGRVKLQAIEAAARRQHALAQQWRDTTPT